MNKVFLFLFLISSTSFGQYFQVHAHNDYAQERPFWAAYEAGCSSIEVDVFLENGQLMVAHNNEDIKEGFTLEQLYLEPLLQISDKQTADLELLIDIKTEAATTLAVIVSELKNYPKLISDKSKIHFVISGNRPEAVVYSIYPSFINFDYQTVLDWPLKMDKVALVSLPFYSHSFWKGDIPLNQVDKEKLQNTIDLVHSKAKKIRFWGTPDTPIAWLTFHELGIDYINTDKPLACFSFLEALNKND
jgi:alkaline phosphatase